MSLSFSDFERLAAKLVLFETRKKCLRFLCAMIAGKYLLRSEYPNCHFLFPGNIGSYSKL